MKTLKEYQEELALEKANAKIKSEKLHYDREIDKARREISELQHPTRTKFKHALINEARNLGNKIKRTGGYVNRNLKKVGKRSGKNISSYTKEMKKHQVKQGYHDNRISSPYETSERKKRKIKKIVYKQGRKIIYYKKPKKHRRTSSRSYRDSYSMFGGVTKNPYSLFG